MRDVSAGGGRSVPWPWMGAAFAAALALAAAVFAVMGAGESGVRTALDLTARWSFLLFFMAYAGRAMAAPWAGRGREFGLAFAAAHLVHVGLVVWLWRILSHAPLQGAGLVFFAAALVWVYVLAGLSFGRLPAVFGPSLWRWFLFLGLNFILLAFAKDFVLGAVHAWNAHRYVELTAGYAPFAAMSLAAPLLRYAARPSLRGRKAAEAAPN